MCQSLFTTTPQEQGHTLFWLLGQKSLEAKIAENDTGGRKEATGVWAWKLETLQPGETAQITYKLENLEKGDWTETDIFYRGSQEIIGAMKMDEKYLEEIRNQEKILKEMNTETPENNSETIDETIVEEIQKVGHHHLLRLRLMDKLHYLEVSCDGAKNDNLGY